MTEKFIRYNNTSICYKTTGNGQPVVLIHGFAEDSSIWDLQVASLKNKFLLILPDLPGSGRSAFINKTGIRIEDYAEIIKSILNAENIGKTVMIGHSMGGYITLAFAEKYPQMLSAFGLLHSSAYADNAEKVETRKKAIEFIRKNGTTAFLKTSIPGLFYDKSNSAPVDALIDKGSTMLPEALIQYYEAMIARPDRTKILKETNLPVLFIIGEHDQAVPFKQSLEQCHLPHCSHISILRESAHMSMIEETQKVNEILRNYLLNL